MIEVKKSNERLTKNYVDSAIDGNRQYAENLFGRATARVQEAVEDRLKTALATIRPNEAQNSASLAQRNSDALSAFAHTVATAACKYGDATGLRVRYVVFEARGTALTAKPVVCNV